MIRVKICPKCGALAEWDSYFGGTRCTRCDFVERPKPTNYERIIRKTPEELAEFLAEYRCVHKAPHCMETNCAQCWSDWLRQEEK